MFRLQNDDDENLKNCQKVNQQLKAIKHTLISSMKHLFYNFAQFF